MLMTDQNSELTTLEALDLVPMPKATKTYRPIRHNALIERAIVAFGNAWDLECTAIQVASGRKGAQLFAKLDFGSRRGEFGRSVALRNSYDQSFAAWWAVGVNVIVCSNGCFSGDEATAMRKHTVHIERDLDGLFAKAASTAVAVFNKTRKELRAMKRGKLTQDQGYAHLGIMQGRGILRAQEISEALRYWDTSPHIEHTDRNVFGLYQAANHGLKRVNPSGAAQSYTRLHEYALAA